MQKKWNRGLTKNVVFNRDVKFSRYLTSISTLKLLTLVSLVGHSSMSRSKWLGVVTLFVVDWLFLSNDSELSQVSFSTELMLGIVELISLSVLLLSRYVESKSECGTVRLLVAMGRNVSEDKLVRLSWRDSWILGKVVWLLHVSENVKGDFGEIV